MQKRWKNIEDYEGYYQVSNFGEVRRLGKKIIKRNHHNQKEVFWEGRLLKTNIVRGYAKVDLCKNGTIKTFQIHRLVGAAFVKNPHNKPNINHKDFNRSNNLASNLEWCTQKENVRHAIRNGRIADNRGEKHGMSKLTEKQVIEIKKKLKTQSGSSIAKEYGMSEQAIYDIKNGRRWGWLTI